MSSRILIDTSAWIEALRVEGEESVRRGVRHTLEEGTAVFCDLVLLELWNGARGERERTFLTSLEAEIECLPTTIQAWRLSRDLARRCRESGLTVPTTDLTHCRLRLAPRR